MKLSEQIEHCIGDIQTCINDHENIDTLNILLTVFRKLRDVKIRVEVMEAIEILIERLIDEIKS